MATSKSVKKSAHWTAGALIYSGRPDPTWSVAPQVATKLASLWDGLPPAIAPLPVPPALGYRGAFLRDAAGREWLAYGGVVTLTMQKRIQSRQDPSRQFEKILLAAAPLGLIPAEFMPASQKK